MTEKTENRGSGTAKHEKVFGVTRFNMSKQKQIEESSSATEQLSVRDKKEFSNLFMTSLGFRLIQSVSSRPFGADKLFLDYNDLITGESSADRTSDSLPTRCLSEFVQDKRSPEDLSIYLNVNICILLMPCTRQIFSISP